jgi:hypothetical protein
MQARPELQERQSKQDEGTKGTRAHASKQVLTIEDEDETKRGEARAKADQIERQCRA